MLHRNLAAGSAMLVTLAASASAQNPVRESATHVLFGAGTTARLGASTLFVESRFTFLPTGGGAVPVRRALTPLTIGIKF